MQKRFPYSYALTALVVLNPANTPAKSFIFHGEDEIELHATINFDVGSKWCNGTIFRRLIKLNKYSNEVTVPPESMDPFSASLPWSSGKVKPRFCRRTTYM